MTDPGEIRRDGAADEAVPPERADEQVNGEATEAAAEQGPAEQAPAGQGPAAEQAPAEQAPADERSREELLDALADAERARDEYVDYLRRERAEFENYRKRSSKERLEALDRGAEHLVTNLLSVLDNFALALEAAESSEDDALRKGVQMVHNEFVGVLTNAGLEEIPGQGLEFDPEQHEAMMQVDAAEELGREVDEPVVAEILRRGYRFKGRVLRPASVKVAR